MAQNDTHETSRLAWHSADVKKRAFGVVTGFAAGNRNGLPPTYEEFETGGSDLPL